MFHTFNQVSFSTKLHEVRNQGYFRMDKSNSGFKSNKSDYLSRNQESILYDLEDYINMDIPFVEQLDEV